MRTISIHLGSAAREPRSGENRAMAKRRPDDAHTALRLHLRRFFKGHSIEVRDWPSGPIYQRVPAFTVYEVGPGPRFGGWTYVTSGCWDVTADEHGHGLEFVLSASERSRRHVEIVTITAFYHAGPADQRLDLGHTVEIGEPWVKGSACTHLLVGLPYAYGPDLEICHWTQGHMRLLALQPITTPEREFTRVHGAEALEQRLETARAPFADPYRSSVV